MSRDKGLETRDRNKGTWARVLGIRDRSKGIETRVLGTRVYEQVSYEQII